MKRDTIYVSRLFAVFGPFEILRSGSVVQPTEKKVPKHVFVSKTVVVLKKTACSHWFFALSTALAL